MKLRLEQKGAPADRVAVIPNWVDTTELRRSRGERLVGRAGARRRVRRHALGERRARAGPRHARPRGDVPPRPRAAADHGDRLRRAARRADAARAAARGDGDDPLPRLPAARAALALARLRRPPLRRARARPLRATSSRAGCTASSPSADRCSSRPTPTARRCGSWRTSAAASSSRRAAGARRRRDPRRRRGPDLARGHGRAGPCLGGARGRPRGRVRPLPAARRRTLVAEQLR